MKKKMFLLIIVIILCTACNGNVTRDIRHSGFTVGNKFNCSRFFPKNKDDTSYEKIAYMTGTHIINDEGKLYEISLGQPFANKENCKEADTSIKVKALLNWDIVKGSDGKYYYLSTQNNVAMYSEITISDHSYYLYDLLLKDDDVVRVITADGSAGLYYILKTDGNIYGNVIVAPNYNSLPQLVSTQIVFSKSDYGSRIVDFAYYGNSLGTFIRTEDTVYRMKVTNYADCSKYADIQCQFEMKEDPIFVKYKDRILAYNGSYILTDYKQLFTVSS